MARWTRFALLAAMVGGAAFISMGGDTAAEEQTSVAEDISRNLTEITAIATANEQNVQRTQGASQQMHGLSGDLNQLTARLHA